MDNTSTVSTERAVSILPLQRWMLLYVNKFASTTNKSNQGRVRNSVGTLYCDEALAL